MPSKDSAGVFCIHQCPWHFVMLKRVVQTGFLLIAVGVCFGFLLLTNQEMFYWQVNQKKLHWLKLIVPPARVQGTQVDPTCPSFVIAGDPGCPR